MTQETLEQVQKAGRLRLHPSLTDPNWLVLRKRRELFQHWLRRIPHNNLWVLDVGGRIQPYRVLLGNSVVRCLAIDVRQSPLVDVVARGEHLPLASERFDLVFCTQVLEYIPDPQLVINEIYRTLKTGGVLLLSAPAVFPRDSDVEYWRFLPCASNCCQICLTSRRGFRGQQPGWPDPHAERVFGVAQPPAAGSNISIQYGSLTESSRSSFTIAVSN